MAREHQRHRTNGRQSQQRDQPTKPVTVQFRGESFRVRSFDTTVADVKHTFDIPDSDTVFVDNPGTDEEIALHDSDTVLKYAQDGAELSHKPIVDDQYG